MSNTKPYFSEEKVPAETSIRDPYSSKEKCKLNVCFRLCALNTRQNIDFLKILGMASPWWGNAPAPQESIFKLPMGLQLPYGAKFKDRFIVFPRPGLPVGFLLSRKQLVHVGRGNGFPRNLVGGSPRFPQEPAWYHHVHGTWYQVRTWYVVLGTWYEVLGIWYQVLSLVCLWTPPRGGRQVCGSTVSASGAPSWVL